MVVWRRKDTKTGELASGISFISSMTAARSFCSASVRLKDMLMVIVGEEVYV
jgi:hypothetical protein